MLPQISIEKRSDKIHIVTVFFAAPQYGTYPFLHRNDDAVVFLGQCFLLGEVSRVFRRSYVCPLTKPLAWPSSCFAHHPPKNVSTCELGADAALGQYERSRRAGEYSMPWRAHVDIMWGCTSRPSSSMFEIRRRSFSRGTTTFSSPRYEGLWSHLSRPSTPPRARRSARASSSTSSRAGAADTRRRTSRSSSSWSRRCSTWAGASTWSSRRGSW